MSISIKFKDDAYLDSSSVAHNKELLSEFLENEKSKLNKLSTYSTEETVVGTWLGKPLYRKVIDCGVIDEQNNNFYDHNIENLGQVIDARAIGYDGTHYYPIPFAAVSSMYSNKNVGFRINATQIAVGVGATTAFATHTVIAILEYTKTTD